MMLLIDSVCLYKPSHVAPKDALSRKSQFELKLPSNEGLLSPRPFTNAQIMFPLLDTDKRNQRTEIWILQPNIPALQQLSMPHFGNVDRATPNPSRKLSLQD